MPLLRLLAGRLARRRLRILLVLFLAPVVVFANPGASAAATSGNLRFAFDGIEYNGTTIVGTRCQVPWSASETGMVLSNQSRCDGGPDVTPGGCQSYEGGCGSWGFVIKDAAGATCASEPLDSFDLEDSSIRSVKTGLGGGFIPFAEFGDCEPVEACLSYYWDGAGPGARDQVACEPLDLDLPEDVEECAYGSPLAANAEWELIQHGTYIDDWQLKVKVDGVSMGVANDPEGWAFTVYWRDKNQPPPSSTAVHGYPLADGFVRRGEAVLHDPGQTTTTPDSFSVYGVQVYYMGNPPAVDPNWWNQPSDSVGRLAQAAFIADKVPTVRNDNFGGLSDPGKCRFWFGPKAVDLPGTDIDEPYEPMPDVEVPDPPAPDPVDEDPDEGNNWLWLIWQALQNIWNTLKGMASAIANAIRGALSSLVDGVLDGLEALFLPGDGYLDSKWDAIEFKWSKTAPSKYLDALTGFDTGSVAGCSGLPLNVTLPGGVAIDEHIGEACSGSMATAATITRTAVSAVVIIGGLMACIRAVGSGLGWNPGIGRGEGVSS